jgi:hypothetical protein
MQVVNVATIKTSSPGGRESDHPETTRSVHFADSATFNTSLLRSLRFLCVYSSRLAPARPARLRYAQRSALPRSLFLSFSSLRSLRSLRLFAAIHPPAPRLSHPCNQCNPGSKRHHRHAPGTPLARLAARLKSQETSVNQDLARRYGCFPPLAGGRESVTLPPTNSRFFHHPAAVPCSPNSRLLR